MIGGTGLFEIWAILCFRFSGTVLHSMRILFCLILQLVSKMLRIIISHHYALPFSLRYKSLLGAA